MGTPPSSAAVTDPRRVSAARRAASVVRDAEPGLVRLTRLARELLDGSAAMVSLVDDEHEHVHAAVGLPPEYSGAAVPLPLSLCVGVVASGAPVVVPDLREHDVLQHHPAVEALGLRCYAGVPLREGSLVLGGLCVLADEPRRWDERSLRVLQDLAAPVARELHLRGLVAELGRARDAQQRLAGEQAALRRVATAVARGRTATEVVEAAAGEVAALLEARCVLVVRFLPGGRTEDVARGGPDQVDATACGGALAQLRSSGGPVVSSDDDRPCLAAPVTVAGRLWGALVACDDEVDPHALVQLASLADLVATGVSNAEAHERLVELSRTDPLTGAANRRAFGERLTEELRRGQRYGTSTALALLDLDRFKALNDTHGHVTGDRVLCELVGRVTAELRTGDVLARLGGDEFAVLLPHTGYEDATHVLDRVNRSVAEVPLAGVPLTATVGAAVVDGGAATPERLYRAADDALYRAKERGRGSLLVERLED